MCIDLWHLMCCWICIFVVFIQRDKRYIIRWNATWWRKTGRRITIIESASRLQIVLSCRQTYANIPFYILNSLRNVIYCFYCWCDYCQFDKTTKATQNKIWKNKHFSYWIKCENKYQMLLNIKFYKFKCFVLISSGEVVLHFHTKYNDTHFLGVCSEICTWKTHTW